MKRIAVFIIAGVSLLCSFNVRAQKVVSSADKPWAVLTSASFWDNWYLDAGIDFSLQKPYSYEFSDSYENGRSWGVNAAVGRWFTPEIGTRFKLNWENGIPLFGKNKANWLGPFFEPGKNMERGGYLVVTGDIQFDFHNIFFGYDPDRKWNLQIYPKAGIAYNFGVSKGTPLLGMGLGNVFPLNDRIKFYADAEVNAVSSGFTGHETTSTGTGSGFNAFFDFNFGVQINLGRRPSGFRMLSDAEGPFGSREVVVCNGFWRNWFVQAGLDMTLQFPYAKDYSEVWTKGRTFGVDAAVGKWFCPELGARIKVNWENSIPLFENPALEWVATDPESEKTNMESGGYFTLVMDLMMNLGCVFSGYDSNRLWNPYIFARAGIGSNIAIQSGSPLVGVGLGISRKVSDRVNIFADACYQSITSEFVTGVEGSNTGMDVPTGHNAFVDFNFGVQWDLGKR